MHVSKRQKFLHRFLTSVLKSPSLINAEVLEGFLKLEDPKSFAAFVKTIDKTRRPINMPDMLTTDGVILCNAENDTEYIRKLNDFVCHSEVLKSRIRSQAISLGQAIETVASILTSVSESFKQLAQLQRTFPQMSTAMSVYNDVADSMSKWVSYEHTKSTHVEEYLDSYLSYHSNELGPLRDLIREKESHYSAFIKAESKLSARKEKLWHQGDTNKWEMSTSDIGMDPAALFADKELALSKMLANETASVRALKDKFAFFNVQVYTESERVFKHGVEDDLENFSDFSKKEAEHCTSLHLAWSQLISRLADLKFDEEQRQLSAR